MAENPQTARIQVANVAHFAEGHSCSVSCVSFGVGRDVREETELAEPSTLPPNRVSQGEDVWKWSMLMYRYAATKMMSSMMTATTMRNEPDYAESELTAVDDASSPGVLLPALEFPEVLLDEVNLGPTVSPLSLWCWNPPGPGP